MRTSHGHQFFAALSCLCIFAAVTAIAADRQRPGVVSQQRTPEQKQQALLTGLRHTLDGLRNVKVKNWDVDIPTPVRPLLTELKHELRDLILVTLNDKAAAWSVPREVPARVFSTLRQNVALVENPEADENAIYAYGEILGIDLTQPAGYPDLLVATTTLWVMCGRDTSFYLFRKVAGAWQLAADQEANDYEDVSGAQGSFQYAVSLPDAAGGFFVVTTNINPWCSSNWQSLRYRVFRVGATPHQPSILLQREETIFLGDEDSSTITIQPESFRIDFKAGQELDAAVLLRKHIVAYQVVGDQVSRVPPLAAEPEGFLDEWINLPWEEAAKWSEPSAPPELREWQEWLHAERAAHHSLFSHEFAFGPPACEVEQGRWQVGIEFSPSADDASLPPEMPGAIYFTVALKDDTYVLENVSASSVPQCTPPQTDELPQCIPQQTDEQ